MKIMIARLRFIAVLAVVLTAMFFAVAPVLEQTASAASQTSLDCSSTASKKWKDAAECQQQKGQWVNNDCYFVPVPIKIGVSIGGLSQATISTYLAAAFNLGIGIAAILAVIFIMIGGFRYIAAAGGGEVEQGKSMIKNAVVGLVLTLLSYTLLQTVNPAILSLNLPPVKMVKQLVCNASSTQNQNMKIGDPCFTIKDKDACSEACKTTPGYESNLCKCTVLPDSAWKTIQDFNSGHTAGTIVKNLVTDLGQAALSGTWGLITCAYSSAVNNDDSNVSDEASAKADWECIKNDVLKGSYDAYGKSVTDRNAAGEEGICYPTDTHDIGTGGACIIDGQCKSGKCFNTSSTGVGFCTRADGTIGSQCKSVDDCSKVNGNFIKCVDLGNGYPECTNGLDQSKCKDNTDCAPGYDCKVISSSLPDRCIKSGTSTVGNGASCTDARTCAKDIADSVKFACVKPYGKDSGLCSDGSTGTVCIKGTSTRDGQATCASGLSCQQGDSDAYGLCK